MVSDRSVKDKPMEHLIIAVAIAIHQGCTTCSETQPHQLIFKCSCGITAAGKKDHTWSLVRNADGTVNINPSVNWMNDSSDESKGSHLHYYANNIPVKHISELVE